jgi:hypothetical protein
MYSYLIITTLITLSIFPSEPLTRERIEKIICEKPVAELHTLLIKPSNNCMEIISQPIYQNMQPYLFFACLPKELRIHTLTQNFFNNDEGYAAQEFESKPYASALWLLAEYELKPKPFKHLLPKYVFLLHPKQLEVVHIIEKQQASPLTTPVISHIGFATPQNPYASLSYEQKETLKTLPNRAIEKSILNNKPINYEDSLIHKEPLNLMKGIFSSCIQKKVNYNILCITSFFGKIVTCAALYDYHPKTAMLSVIIDTTLMALSYCRNSSPFSYMPTQTISRTFIDLLNISIALCYKNYTYTHTSLKFSTIPYIAFLGIPCISLLILRDRAKVAYPNRFTIHSKKQNKFNGCTIL